MKLKLDRPTKMWAAIENGDQVPYGMWPFLSFDKKYARDAGVAPGGTIERVLVTVTRLKRKEKAK